MDRVDLFRIFARVVESASFTRAADTLGMPRSSVSAAIQELEGRVGARLLHRTTRKVSPTQDGAALYARCLALIADIEEIEGLFRQTSAGPSGKLRFDVPGRLGRLVIAPALPEFLRTYPEIEIELGVTDMAVNLVEEGVDCVLRVGALRSSGLVARTIGELPLINVASADYLRQHGVPRHPDDLRSHLAVNYASPSSGRAHDWEWVQDGTAWTTPMRSRVSVNSAEAYIACCLAGIGLIQVPAYDVKRHLDAGELVEVMPHYRAAPMPMSLVYPHRRPVSRRLQVFVDWLLEVLKREVLS